MKRIYSVSLKVSELDRSKIFKSDKTGISYANLNIRIDTEADEEYKQLSVWENQSKEERDAKENKKYLDSGAKLVWEEPTGDITPSIPTQSENFKEIPEKDDLPF